MESLEHRDLLAITPFAADSMFELPGGNPGVEIAQIAAETNGNLVAFGRFQGTVDFDRGPGVVNLTSSGSDLFVARYSPVGNLLGVVDLSDGDAFAYDVAVDPNGSVYVSGSYSTALTLLGGVSLPAPAQGVESAFVAKLDSTLQTTEWHLQGEADAFSLSGISTDSLGDKVYVGGEAFGVGNFGGENFNLRRSWTGFVSRIDAATGQLEWSQYLKDVGHVSITVDPTDPNAIYARERVNASDEATVLRLDTDGNVVWQRTIDNNIYWTSAPVASNGSLYLAGRFGDDVVHLDGTSLVPNGIDALVVGLDGATGDVTWAQQAGGPGWDSSDALAVDSNGNLFLAGEFEDTAQFGADTLVASTDSDRFVTQVNAADGTFIQTWRYGRATVNGIATRNGNTYVIGSHDPASIDFPSGDLPQSNSGDLDYVMRFVPAADPTVPRVNGFLASPNPVDQGSQVDLTVVGLYDPAGRVNSVAFYHDVNGDRRVTPGTDTLVGTDSKGADGWSVAGSTAGLSLGANTFLAQAAYDVSLLTLPVSAVADVRFPVDESAVTYASDDVPLDIGEGPLRTSTISVADFGTVNDVNVQLDISHDAVGQLNAWLVGPDGTRVELFTNAGYINGNNMEHTTIDDEAVDDNGDPINILDGSAPFSGDYQPEGLLSGAGLHLFDGRSGAGTWTLELLDDTNYAGPGDSGYLNAWSITLTPSAPPAPSFSINDVQVLEGDSGTATAEFVVTRSGDASQQVSVEYSTADVSAIAGIDYQGINNATLTFVPGITSLPVSVTVQGDTAEESDETFLLVLSNPVGATISDDRGLVTIHHDDRPLVADVLYVYDIRFDSKRGGKDWRAEFEIRSDADGDGLVTENDAPAAGVLITVTFAGQTYSGVTDSFGIFRTNWIKNLSNGDHYANAVDLVLAGYVWNVLDMDAEDDSDGDGKPDEVLMI
ncbi:MAG: proprotein convertase P-domain-containing protein [Planctomycetales bacterium]|nr:proprotein convertase P-domain-containing protein [Planctomycetales bacterium]